MLALQALKALAGGWMLPRRHGARAASSGAASAVLAVAMLLLLSASCTRAAVVLDPISPAITLVERAAREQDIVSAQLLHAAAAAEAAALGQWGDGAEAAAEQSDAAGPDPEELPPLQRQASHRKARIF